MSIDDATPAGATRRLGRSRRYTGADLPERLQHWHAPRANRWEHLVVVAGTLAIEWLEAAEIVREELREGSTRWIVPGCRWRVAALADGAAFELEIHADETCAPAAPQLLRARFLQDATRVSAADAGQLRRMLDAATVGELLLIETPFDAHAPFQAALGADARLFWHPLEIDAGRSIALAGRTATATELGEYLGRDHALIEAVLAGALAGDDTHLRWLHAVLARHLVIEEEMLFPAWLECGGNAGWVRGLINEHRHLREQLPHIRADAAAQRRFVLLLDGHDEKEERIVYPEIIAQLGSALDALTRRVVMLGTCAMT